MGAPFAGRTRGRRDLRPVRQRGAHALAFSVVGEDVLVTGCGPIGLMSIAVARHVGARFIVASDVSPARLELAMQMGADATVDVSRERIRDVQPRLGMREGFDVGFEMSGSAKALPEMIENMNHGGRIALLGLPPSRSRSTGARSSRTCSR